MNSLPLWFSSLFALANGASASVNNCCKRYFTHLHEGGHFEISRTSQDICLDIDVFRPFYRLNVLVNSEQRTANRMEKQRRERKVAV